MSFHSFENIHYCLFWRARETDILSFQILLLFRQFSCVDLFFTCLVQIGFRASARSLFRERSCNRTSTTRVRAFKQLHRGLSKFQYLRLNRSSLQGVLLSLDAKKKKEKGTMRMTLILSIDQNTVLCYLEAFGRLFLIC